MQLRPVRRRQSKPTGHLVKIRVGDPAQHSDLILPPLLDLAAVDRRFGLAVPVQQHTGADIAGLVDDGDFEAVRRHCLADVAATVALARRLGVLPEPEVF